MDIPNDHIELITTTFDRFSANLLRFSEHLMRSDHPVHIGNFSGSSEMQKAHANNIFANIWHQDGKDGRRTQSHYGLIGADTDLIIAAKDLNISKTDLKNAISLLKQQALPEINARLHKRATAVASTLNMSGLGRLHLKQCYRTIPLLDSRPDKVRFSWYTSGRSIRKLSVDDAMERLLKMDTSQVHINIQLEKLQRLPNGIQLAQIQPQAPLVRANFAWKEHENQWKRQARNCPLPILIPLPEGQILPSFNELSEEPPITRQRALRADSIIDPEPFLPSLRVHLYRTA